MWALAVDALGAEETREHLAEIMGQRGPDVNPVDTDWGMSPEAQAQLRKMSGMIPSAAPSKQV